MYNSAGMVSLLLATAGLARCMATADSCIKHSVDFILLAGNPLMSQIEDDIARDLERVGVTVNTRLLEKLEFNEAMQTGDFNLCFTESWGPPYDPHSFATGWFREANEAHYAAMEGMEPPMTKAQMQTLVTNVLRVENEATRRTQWKNILQEMHSQAISNPMWSRQMPAIWNRRLSNYQAGPQQFDYPMHTINVIGGSTTIKVAPGANTGMFCCIGEMGPHSYTPNEFFIQNWIYEGLVSYGADGVILPQLAVSWVVTNLPSGKVQYTFTLRPGVTFHDGSACDCNAVKMTFDHVLQPPLNTLDWHGWYQLPLVLESTACSDSSTLVITLSEFYYPFLQELSLIRPIRVLSPESYVNGPSTDPVLNNSCREGWGNPTSPTHAPGVEIHCSGIRSFNGTGPWIFDGTLLNGDGSIAEVHLVRNPNWWGTRGNVERIHVIHYEDENAVEAALLDNSLDMVVGGGVLLPSQVSEFAEQHTDRFETIRGPPLMNQIIVLNSNKAPTDDIAFRRLIMHAVDKASIIDAEMPGMAQVADSLYPKDAPYCNVDLTPRWDYDFEKAQLMNCPAATATVTVTVQGDVQTAESSGDDDDNTGLILGLCLGLGIPLLLLSAFVAFYLGKKSGYKELGGKEERKVEGNTEVIGTQA